MVLILLQYLQLSVTHNRVGKSQAQAFAVNYIYRFRLGERGKSCVCCLNGRIFDVDATEADQNELLIYSVNLLITPGYSVHRNCSQRL